MEGHLAEGEDLSPGDKAPQACSIHFHDDGPLYQELHHQKKLESKKTDKLVLSKVYKANWVIMFAVNYTLCQACTRCQGCSNDQHGQKVQRSLLSP